MQTRNGDRLAVVLVMVCVAAAGCGSAKPNTAPATHAPSGAGSAANTPTAAGSNEAPVAPESNPPGDIPDNQAFVAYRSDPGGFQVKVPEGWARADSAGDVTFTDHLNTIQLTWQAASSPPSVDRANAVDVPALQRSQPAFQLTRVTTVSLPGGPAVLIEAQENSPPNSVTGRRYRLDVQRYLFGKGGQQAVLLLSSPVGADNVDPWKMVSESFRWR
jgi:hypothetical protein